MQKQEFGTSKLATKAILYLRVSTEEQVENYSLNTQQAICTKEAERRGLEIVQVFKEEGRSAKNITGRPVLIELLEFCRKHKRDVDAVIVYRLDRLSRQTSDYLNIRKKLAECEIILISATEPTGTSPTEKFLETMLAGFAQMDNDVKSERSKNGLKARFHAGLLMTGVAPLGYLNQDGYVIIDPNTFEKVKLAWELMATGTKTLREIASVMNEQGLLEKHKGQEFPIRYQTAQRIFRNKFYAGKIVSKKFAQEVQGQHTPMVTEEQYYLVQAVLDGRNRNSAISLARRSIDNPEFPLRRIVTCQRCGGFFTGAWSKGKNALYAYYFCTKRCGSPSIPTGKVETEMCGLLERVTPTPQTLDLLTAFLRKTYYQRVTTLQKRRDEADRELKKLYELRQALIQKNLSGVYSDEIFKEQNTLIEGKIKDILLTKEDSVLDKYNLEAITQFIYEKFANLHTTYDESNLEQKKILLCSIFPSGVPWYYPGYSNTKISPYHQTILEFQNSQVPHCAEGGT